MNRPKLFSGTRNASSWAMRAWLALREAGIEFDEEIVDIRRPQRFANLARISKISPSASVPVLVVGEEAIFDSLAIMEYANDSCGGQLLPADPIERAKARSIMSWQHAGLSGTCSRISFESAFYPVKRRLTDEELAECGRLFCFLENLLESSGGPWLFGDVSLADLMLAPTAVRLSRHLAQGPEWPAARKWMEALQARDSVSEWMTHADRQPHIWFDDYLSKGSEVPEELVQGSEAFLSG
jgi:glutathione S-transferase